ncbi:MAG: ABC transporter ATP-binding protein [Verrucomicrobia bacterium]|nr:ABC transporter ATP-binding protein [Verrucomicrobiota bacterium]
MIQRFRPYFKYLQPHRGLLSFAILCGILAGVASGFGLPYMVKKVFPVIFAKDALPLTPWELTKVTLWIPAVFLVRGVATYLNTYFIQLVGTQVLETIRLDFFRKLQVLPLSFFQKNSTGDLLSRGLADANQLQVTLTTVANEIVRSPASLIGSIGIVAWIAYEEQGVALVLVTLAVVPLSVLPIRYVGKKLIKRAGQIQAELGGVTSIFSENLSATKEVRAFNLEERELARFGRASQTLIRAQMKFVKYEKALTPLIEIISAVGIAFTLLYAYKVHLSQETFITLITALYASYEPIKKLGSLNNELKRGLGALDRLEEVLQTHVAIVDSPDARPLGRAHGALTFENVSFSYQAGEIVLNQVSVQIPAGTVCALVGPSGAGKSTFANLVPRFFDPVGGRVLLDGHDLHSLRLADLRRNIAIVSQDPVLFNDTIYENLLIARPEATREELEAAARAAYAHEFILSFPAGYDTVVGERGARLSGGQKQRLALARAFLRNAPILILDEATSALDSDSEAAIQAALKQLVVGKTVLIIAHRFSTIRDATKIIVFDAGEIAAIGSHAELYAANPLYRSLYDRQTASA